MRRVALIVAIVGAIGLAGCGSSSTTSSPSAGTASASATTSGNTAVSTAKFVLHAGLAFGAFHQFIYKPVKAGDLKHPFENKLTLVKAGLAAVFVYHELKVAVDEAKGNKLLQPVVAPLTAAADKLSGLKSSITGGSVNPSDITAINSQLSQAKDAAASKGQSITEKVPSLSQLGSGG